ncbi:MAG: hypothetical protein H0T51_17490 [Pirellulales bacterium]|nr:hypothetical protein [Pirellulales bacterium]
MLLGSDKDGKPAAVHDSIMAGDKTTQGEPLANVGDLRVQVTRHSPPAAASHFPTLGWRRISQLTAPGRGSWPTGCCDAEKLNFNGYSVFC